LNEANLSVVCVTVAEHSPPGIEQIRVVFVDAILMGSVLFARKNT
jgi:hypothetical protein